MLEYRGSECLALLIVLGDSLVQGLLGIGFGLLAAPLLYLLDPSYVPGPILLLGFLLACCMLLGNHQALAWRRRCRRFWHGCPVRRPVARFTIRRLARSVAWRLRAARRLRPGPLPGRPLRQTQPAPAVAVAVAFFAGGQWLVGAKPVAVVGVVPRFVPALEQTPPRRLALSEAITIKADPASFDFSVPTPAVGA